MPLSCTSKLLSYRLFGSLSPEPPQWCGEHARAGSLISHVVPSMDPFLGQQFSPTKQAFDASVEFADEASMSKWANTNCPVFYDWDDVKGTVRADFLHSSSHCCTQLARGHLALLTPSTRSACPHLAKGERGGGGGRLLSLHFLCVPPRAYSSAACDGVGTQSANLYEGGPVVHEGCTTTNSLICSHRLHLCRCTFT